MLGHVGEFFLRLPFGGDVLQTALVGDDGSRCIPDGPTRVTDPDETSVEPNQLSLVVADDLRIVEEILLPLPVLRIDVEVRRSLPQQRCLVGIAEHLGQRRIGVLDGSIGRCDREADGHVLEQSLVAVLKRSSIHGLAWTFCAALIRSHGDHPHGSYLANVPPGLPQVPVVSGGRPGQCTFSRSKWTFPSGSGQMAEIGRLIQSAASCARSFAGRRGRIAASA